MKKFITYILVLLVLGGMVIGGMKIIQSKKAADAKNKPAKEYEIVVKTFTPKISQTMLTLPFLATTKSNDDVKISSKIPARIEYIVKSGKNVKKGDVIVKLDDKDFQIKLEALNLNMKSLKSQLNSKNIALQNLLKIHKRTEELLKVRGASKEQFDKETTNIEALKAGIKTLEYKIKELNANKNSIKNMLSYTKVLAPVSGVVTNMANVGDVAMPGHPLVSISADSNSYLLVRLPSDVKAKELIYNGKKVKLSPLNTTFNGLLEYLANIDESLAANQRVEVDVVVYDDMGYKLPIDTVLNRDGKSYVLTINGNKASAKLVNIVSAGEQGVVVTGVDSNDKLVVAKPDILLKLLSGISVKGI
ncbi:efflux RND transporter periplasmic adaptor subunit [Sulfurospirillum sp. 1307]|jgi:RND family efflux transporter MFP subunit